MHIISQKYTQTATHRFGNSSATDLFQIECMDGGEAEVQRETSIS